MPTQLSIGYMQTVAQNVITALPARRVIFYTDAGTWEHGSDGTNFTALTLTNGQAEIGGGFVRKTDASTADVLLTAI